MAIDTDLTSLWKLQANGDDHIGPYNPQAITGVTFVTDSSKQVADFSSGQIRYDPNTIDGISTNFTIACWLKVDTIQDSIILTNAYSGATFPSLQLSVRPGGTIRFQFYTSNGAGGANTVETPSAISASTWYHFVFSYDGSTMTIYQDGSSVATQSASGSPFTNGYSISVGSYRPYSSGLFLDGRMSDLALWYRAITSTEASSIYSAGLANFSSLFPAAVVPDIAGTVGVPATFDGSASTAVSYYRWSWVSVPGGSAIANAPIPFPDSGATSPINMTGNLALYHFEATGATTPDTSGGGRDLTVNGATQVAGKVGSYALDFDGTNDYLEYTAADVLPGTTNEITIAFWQYGAPGLGNNSILWAEDGSGNRVVNIHLPYGGQIYFDCGNSGSSYDRLNRFALPSDYSGGWNHWAFTKDVATATMRIYLNGAPWHSGAGNTNTLSTIVKLVVGSQEGTSGFYEGKIDELAIWSRVLTADEIADIYLSQNGTLAGMGSNTFTFTPDIDGTYEIELEVASGVSVNAEAVISPAPAGEGVTRQGEALQGASFQPIKLQGDM